MELKQLEYFLAICRELHFTRAAEKLGIAQPSLSQQIRLLEHEIGTPLFDRIGKKIALTEAGGLLQTHALHVFHELAQAKAAIGELQGLKRGSLKLGALPSVASDLLPPALARFHARYPTIELSVEGARTGEIVDRLIRNELDIGIVMSAGAEGDLFERMPLYRDELVFAVPPNHPFAPRTSLPLAALRDMSAILFPPSFVLRRQLDEACGGLGFELKPVMEMTTTEALLRMVATGAGLSIVPASAVKSGGGAGVRAIPLEGSAIPTEVALIYRKHKHLCAASRAFIQELEASVRERIGMS
ncbi:LysR family transcriptional regulator [Paenibacillus methanolicus]|uniref:DNA-binding transcriptional LysR family regulator n=1 Tax=Paenibacillus methanolicus TaxID=582686 RepID=A0A5S5C874_9BACL|nr:LysR family transcriptional regulator [Paenibacillus methanolicus]TYP74682.1 DNA-binding transcriptional LysR family regulator [Paenibacillus methanolicus]